MKTGKITPSGVTWLFYSCVLKHLRLLVSQLDNILLFLSVTGIYQKGFFCGYVCF